MVVVFADEVAIAAELQTTSSTVGDPPDRNRRKKMIGNSNQRTTARTPLGQRSVRRSSAIQKPQPQRKMSSSGCSQHNSSVVKFSDATLTATSKENADNRGLLPPRVQQQSAMTPRRPTKATAAATTTPVSLLRNEFNLDGDDARDESLLFSPGLFPMPTQRPQAARRSSSGRPTTPSSTVAAIVAQQQQQQVLPKNAACRSSSNNSSSNAKTPAKRKTQESKTLISLEEESEVDTRPSNNDSDLAKPQQSDLPLKNSRLLDPDSDNSRVDVVPERGSSNDEDGNLTSHLRVTTSIDTSLEQREQLPEPPLSAESDWSVPPAALTVPTTTSVAMTPFTPGNFCLDLSNMFQGAQSAVRPARSQTVTTTGTAATKTMKKSTSNARAPTQTTQFTLTRTTKGEATHETSASHADAWANQQCEIFCSWLNFTLSPPEELDATNTPDNGIGLRHIQVVRRMAAVRQTARQFYHQDPKLQAMQSKFRSEINKGRISIRPDRDPCADLTMRQQILQLLLGYNTPWLRIGLEAMFGVDISPVLVANNKRSLLSPRGGKKGGEGSFFMNNTTMATSTSMSFRNPKEAPLTRMKHALKKFILENVLSDDKILGKYTRGRCKVPSGKFEKEYRAKLRNEVAFRLLCLFCFLDKAKEANLLDKVPRLFAKTAPVKSTKDVLLTFCRTFLQSEGNFIRHLSRMGVTVSYKQEPVDELDFEVSNLATDLRDGTRLARLLEILTNAPHQAIMRKLRLPATSRLQKLHNVGLVITKIRDDEHFWGVDIKSQAHHIVDANRAMVLHLMWSVMSNFCLAELVDVAAVQAEITRIERYPSGSTSSDHGVMTELMEGFGHDPEGLGKLLLRWAQAVCRTFTKDRSHNQLAFPDNLTDDFRNGRVFCQLIHYYHPTLLQLGRIRAVSSKDNDVTIELLENEKANSRLANSCMMELGGIPEMIPNCDSLHPPEAKSTVLCLAFLCSRLLESSTEIRAVRLIQSQYRNYRAQILLEQKMTAASFIWTHWKAKRISYFVHQRRRYRSHVMVIENFVMRHRARLGEIRQLRLVRQNRGCAATKIQTQIRGVLARIEFKLIWEEHIAAVLIQTSWRGFVDRCYASCLQSQLTDHRQNMFATRIQSVFRMYAAKISYAIDLQDIIVVQSCVRRFLIWPPFRLQRDEAILIQRVFRGFVVRAELADTQVRLMCGNAAMVIQKSFRRMSARKRGRASTSIQAAVRGYLERCRFLTATVSVTKLQSFVRAALWSMKFRYACSGVIQFQAQARSYIAVREFQDTTCRVVTCQSVVRRWQASRATVRLRGAVLTIQQSVRCRLARQSYCNLLVAKQIQQQVEQPTAIRLQSAWRMRRQCNLFRQQRCSATRIQCMVRCRFARREWTRKRKSILRIQSAARQFLGSRIAHNRLKAVVVAQSVVRRHQAFGVVKAARLGYQEQCRSATLVQKMWRGYYSFSLFRQSLSCAPVVQKCVRRFLAERKYRSILQSTVTIQGLVRRGLACQLRKRRQWEYCKLIVPLQALLRGYIVRREVALMEASATSIQTAFRSFNSRANFLVAYADIVKAQTIARRFLVRQWLALLNDASSTIQRAVRVLQSSRQLACLRAARTIQCAFRKHKAIHYLKVKKSQAAAESQVTAAVILQRNWRMVVERCDYLAHLQYRDQLYGAIRFQRLARGYLVRSRARRDAAAKYIQKTWRCFDVHVNYLILFQGTLRIQAFTRGVLSRQELNNRRVAATVITKFGMLSVHRIRVRLIQHRAATLLQSMVRTYITTLAFRHKVSAVINMQRSWRGYDARADYEITLRAAIRIQSVVRGLLGKEVAKALLAAVARREQICEDGARIIQACFRSFRFRLMQISASETICNAAKRYLARNYFRRLRKCIVIFQSNVRARKVRRRMPKRLKDRIVAANNRAASDPRLQLGNKTKAALAMLGSQRLSEILKALHTLEFATRYSRECSIAFSAAGAFATLLDMIPSLNRSLPHIEIARQVLQTMSNVVKHDEALELLVTDPGLHILFDSVQAHRDNEILLWLSVHLLGRFVSYHHDLRVQYSTEKNTIRLKSVLKLVMRKFGGGACINAAKSASLKSKIAEVSNGYSEAIEVLAQIICIIGPS